MVSMDCVAVEWLVWVALLVGDVAGWSVYEVFAVGWLLLLFWEGGRRLAVGGVSGVWLGTWGGG